MITQKLSALVKRVYDISLNSLGVRSQKSEVRSQESGVRSQESGVRREERQKKPRVEGESFSGSVKVTEFYRAFIRTRYHTSNYQRQKL